MAREFKLPDLGEGVDEGEVVSVLVSEGDALENGQGIIEVETGKATAEIPIDFAGTVQSIAVGEGDTVRVGDVIATLDEQGDGEEEKEDDDEQTTSSTPKGDTADSADANGETEPDSENADSGGAETVEVKLPDLGEGIEEGEVVSVLVGEGDVIENGDGLLELETGKATAEVPSEIAGTVKAIKVSEGETVRVGAVIAVVESSGGSSGGGNDKAQEKAKSSKKRSSSDDSSKKKDAEDESESRLRKEVIDLPVGGPVMATPSVRRLARELGVNVRAVEGTGRGGRITDEDVKAAARELIVTGQRTYREAVSKIREEAPDYDDYGPIEHEKMSAVRKATARQMARCWAEVPHVTHFGKTDWTAVEDARKRLAEQNGDKVSVTAILVALVGQALKAHPRVNAKVDMQRQEAMLRKYVNIGVAVDTPRGLLVPVVRNVDRKPVLTINRELKDLAGRARDGKIRSEELEGAGFSISNIGGLGGGWFTPIVNVPEGAILGVGAAEMQPVYENGEFVAKPLCPLSFSYDHRLIDGADAARFLKWLTDAIEQPLLTLLQGD